jgi:hypothetical protein
VLQYLKRPSEEKEVGDGQRALLTVRGVPNGRSMVILMVICGVEETELRNFRMVLAGHGTWVIDITDIGRMGFPARPQDGGGGIPPRLRHNDPH